MHNPYDHDPAAMTIDSWCGLIWKKQHRTFSVTFVISNLTFKKLIIQLGMG